MKIEIRGLPSGAPEEIRSYAERRLRFALGRFAGGVERVVVRFWDANGPRGGVDKECQMRARLIGGGEVLVRDVDADRHVVIDRAADRLGRAVGRLLDWHREVRMPRRSRPDRAR